MWKIAFKKFELIWSAEVDHITSNLLKAVFHKFSLVHYWILCPIFKICFTIFNILHESVKALIHFQSMLHFYTPWNHQKTGVFPMFSGGHRSGTLIENGLNLNCGSTFLLFSIRYILLSSYSSVVYGAFVNKVW